MAEWWIYGQSVQRKKYSDGWVLFQEYVPDKSVYSIGMSKPISNRYDAYWTIFFKVDRTTANKIFKIMKELYANGYLKAFRPSGPEGLSLEDKKTIAQKVAEKLNRGFTIIAGDKEISISPPDLSGPPPDVPLPPLPSTEVDSSATLPGFKPTQQGGPGTIGGLAPGAPTPRYMNPQAQLVDNQQGKEGSKRKWLFIGGGGLLFVILIVVAVFFLKRK